MILLNVYNLERHQRPEQAGSVHGEQLDRLTFVPLLADIIPQPVNPVVASQIGSGNMDICHGDYACMHSDDPPPTTNVVVNNCTTYECPPPGTPTTKTGALTCAGKRRVYCSGVGV